MRYNLKQVEAQLREKIATDIQDPEIYSLIYDMVSRLLYKMKILWVANKIEEVAHYISEDLYLRLVLKGEDHTNWIGFIYKVAKPYISQWNIQYNKQIIDTTGKLGIQDLIERMSYANPDNEQIHNADLSDFVKSLPILIDKTIDASRYFYDSKDGLNARISLILSVTHNRYVSFNQTEANKRYTELLYKVLMEEIKNEIYVTNRDEMPMFDTMRLFALENNKENVDLIGEM